MTFTEALKKIFPISYKKSLLHSILYYVLAMIAGGLIIFLSTLLTGWIPVVGVILAWLLGIASGLMEIYVIAGIVVSILIKLEVLK